MDNLEEKGISTFVTAKGTAEGFILRLDGRTDEEELKDAMIDFVDARKSFIAGSDVTIEWIGVLPDEQYVSNIMAILAKEYKINVKENRLKTNSIVREKVKSSMKDDDNTGASLFDGLNFLNECSSSERESGDHLNIRNNMAKNNSSEQDVIQNNISKLTQNSQNNGLWDEANARVICATLRSGQKIETEHSLLVLGDVNYGAEIIAGGDVIVLGALRGIAHAGAYDETGGGRVIFALDLRPTQLRIGSIISRDGNESNQKLPEMAHVDGDLIVVEPYNSRSWKRKG